MPRSLLPELPDIRAQAIFEQWKLEIISALRSERSRRSSRRARSPSPHSRSDRTERSRRSRNRSLSSSLLPAATALAQRSSRRRAADTQTSSSSSSRSSSPTPSPLARSEPALHALPVPNAQPPEDFNWRSAAWSVGSRVLDELLAIARREHFVRTEQRQLNGQVAAANAHANSELWSTVATWGTWGAQALLMHYFGGNAFRNAQRLIRN